MQYELTRDVTRKECDWLEEDMKKGTLVYRFSGPTYGCIGYSGIACCMEEGENPFFELPFGALSEIKKEGERE